MELVNHLKKRKSDFWRFDSWELFCKSTGVKNQFSPYKKDENVSHTAVSMSKEKYFWVE